MSIPPVAPADVPAIFHPRVGDIYLRWGRDVYLRCFWCIPPVVSPTLGESKFKYTSGGSCGRACNVPPIDGTSTCGAKIYHIEPDTARSPRVSARRKGAKVTSRPQRYAEQMETHRRARCGGTFEIGEMYGDCKRKRVGEDFSAFVHTKTAKHFGNY